MASLSSIYNRNQSGVAQSFSASPLQGKTTNPRLKSLVGNIYIPQLKTRLKSLTGDVQVPGYSPTLAHSTQTVPPPTQTVPPPTQTVSQPTPQIQQPYSSEIPMEYINPKTGTFYKMEDFAPKQQYGDIPQYAGDTLTEGNQSAEQLSMRAADLVNARNDIATGASDPYKVASESGIPYSPEEMRAIEKAYAGIYDPAINSAIEKLNQKREMDLIKFRTDEGIREYQATKNIEDSYDNSTYTIKPGDDLRKIAQALGFTYESLQAANPYVDEYNLKPGQKIVLPTGGMIKEREPTKDEKIAMYEAAYIDWLNEYIEEHNGDEPEKEEKARVMRSLSLKPSDYGIYDIE